MEYHFKSDIDSDIFEPNDTSLHAMLSYQVTEALSELEDRISVDEVNIVAEDSAVFAEIRYTVLAYNTSNITKIKVGDLNVAHPN